MVEETTRLKFLVKVQWGAMEGKVSGGVATETFVARALIYNKDRRLRWEEPDPEQVEKLRGVLDDHPQCVKYPDGRRVAFMWAELGGDETLELGDYAPLQEW